MADTMIERIAAILRDVANKAFLQGTSGGSIDIDARVVARAILTAMREPTEAMVTAGNGSNLFNFTGYFEGKVHPVQRSWPAMIDAALASG